MLGPYELFLFCLALFSLSAAGFLFMGNMLKKWLFSVIICLASLIFLICLPAGDIFLIYAALFICVFTSALSCLLIIFVLVPSLHTLDSGALKEDD